LSIVIAAEIGGQSAGETVHNGGPLGVYSLLPYVLAFGGLLAMEHYLREPRLRPESGVDGTRPSLPRMPVAAAAAESAKGDVI
jgi:hypothetical protein